METKNHVLLVEDQPALRRTLERALRLYRYDVKAVETGPEAQESFATEPVDILLSDVSLTGPINGFELAHWARALWPRLPIVLISGVALYDPPAEMLADPRISMLAKPFTIATLMAALAELLLQK
jgi:DNA-binding NtrC family response regulator